MFSPPPAQINPVKLHFFDAQEKHFRNVVNIAIRRTVLIKYQRKCRGHSVVIHFVVTVSNCTLFAVCVLEAGACSNNTVYQPAAAQRAHICSLRL